MSHGHKLSGYFGPPPTYCFCCGQKYGGMGDCVQGPRCGCEILGACRVCHKCKKHCQCAMQPEKKTAADFDYIYNADGTCDGRWDCGKQGVILAYDDFTPEGATWFCEDCWEELGIVQPMFIIVKDKREGVKP